MDYYYIYIFFDPTNANSVFYCGRGTGNRPKGHLNQAAVSTVSRPAIDDILGATAQDVLDTEKHDSPDTQPNTAQASKVRKIQDLTRKNVTPNQMIRVIATGISFELSQTMESFCIHHVYGTAYLLNIASGKNKSRFRPHGMWDLVDWPEAEKASLVAPYYTYVLRNPKTNEVKYVGKGKSDRCFAHFKDIDTISDEERDKKQKALTELLDQRFAVDEIVRLIAVGLNEDEALAIESFCIKYVFGPNTNAVMGHHPNRFRAKDDWDLRIGFDIPFLATANGTEARQKELDQWLGQGYLSVLQSVVAPFPGLQFSGLFNHGAGSPAIAATVYSGCGAGGRVGEERGTVYVFAFSPIKFGISIEIRWNGKEQRECFGRKFRTFKIEEWPTSKIMKEDLNYQNRRREMVFLPDAWADKPTVDLAVARERLTWMIALLQTNSLEELSEKIGEAGVFELLHIDVELRARVEGKRKASEWTRKAGKLRELAGNRATREQCIDALTRSNGDFNIAKQLMANSGLA